MATKYRSMKEAAAILGVTRSYMYLLKDAGRIHATRVGAQWVVSLEELEWFKERRKERKLSRARLELATP